eukprot:scaffold10130_cov97-Isochrysis_galbana.AAC.5
MGKAAWARRVELGLRERAATEPRQGREHKRAQAGSCARGKESNPVRPPTNSLLLYTEGGAECSPAISVTSSTAKSPEASSGCSRCRSYTQKPVSLSSGNPPMAGPATKTGEATMADATCAGRRVESKAPPPKPAVR